MPTFLVNSRMPKELRARVEASVRADIRQRVLFGNQGQRWRYLRVLLLLATAGLAIFLVITYRQSRREVEERRAEILAQYRRLKALVPAETRARLERLAPRLTGPPVDAGVESRRLERRSLEELLKQPLLYVRVDAKGLERPQDQLPALAKSELDALAACLISPPDSKRESTLLRAIGRPPPPDRIFAAAEALAAFDFFYGTFEKEVETAQHMQELERHSARLRRDTLASGVKAARARILLLAVDGPKAADQLADFDGEAPHDIVLRVFDLTTSQLLWHGQRHVNPKWISDKSRLAYSRPLDSCRLAHELLSPHADPSP